MKKALKWLGILIGGVLVLVLLAIGIMYFVTEQRMNRTYEVSPVQLTAVPGDSAVLERGARVIAVRGCTGCHGADLGGEVMSDDFVFGRLSASNLTAGRGGIGGQYADRDWVRAIRHGIGADGKPLVLMPAYEYTPLGREDLEALVAYLKQVPPVDRELPENRIGPLARALYLSGSLPLVAAERVDHNAPLEAGPLPGLTAEYGEYLSHSCTGCHGEGLKGAKSGPPGTPPGTDLTTLRGWSAADFERAVRQGVRPTGDTLHAFMPRWSMLSDEEVQAIWTYVQTLPAPGERTAAR